MTKELFWVATSYPTCVRQAPYPQRWRNVYYRTHPCSSRQIRNVLSQYPVSAPIQADLCYISLQALSQVSPSPTAKSVLLLSSPISKTQTHSLYNPGSTAHTPRPPQRSRRRRPFLDRSVTQQRCDHPAVSPIVEIPVKHFQPGGAGCDT